MAASKKNTNSTKTAHVMNLLSKNRPSEASEEIPAVAEPMTETNQPVPTPHPSPSISPIMASLAPDATVSTQIKSALEDALLSEGGMPAAEPVVEPAPQPASEPMEVPAVEPVANPTPDPVAEPVPEPTPEPVVEPVPEPVAVVEQAPPKFLHVNVMQVLVEEIAEKYIEMFGLCNCPRCATDVKALALNNLTPKYVVMNEGEMIPRITLYENRYKSSVVAQVLNACKVVASNPHHER